MAVAFTPVEEAVASARPLAACRPLLVVSDFDGTLAPLSSDPWAPLIVPSAQRALRALAAREGVTVRLLSGRGALDLASRVRVGGAGYLGDHGAEQGSVGRGRRWSATVVAREAASEAELALAARLAAEVRDEVPEPWLVIERKDPTVCFHFRAAPDIEAARARILAVLERMDPDAILARRQGRRAVEVRPRDATSKGTAMRRLLEAIRPAAVLALGDDPLDRAVFEVVTEARTRGMDGLCVAVASHPEWLAVLAPAADLVLADPVATGRFLSGFARNVLR